METGIRDVVEGENERASTRRGKREATLLSLKGIEGGPQTEGEGRSYLG